MYNALIDISVLGLAVIAIACAIVITTPKKKGAELMNRDRLKVIQAVRRANMEAGK